MGRGIQAHPSLPPTPCSLTHRAIHNCSILDERFYTLRLNHHKWTNGPTDGPIDEQDIKDRYSKMNKAGYTGQDGAPGVINSYTP